jgi:hypothetical protein
MNHPFVATIAAALCVALASCYPYEDYQKRKKATQAPQKPTPEQQAKIKQDELGKKQQEELKKTEQTPTTAETTVQPTPPPIDPPQNPAPPPTDTRRSDYPFANKVPGKDGFVFSPYNNKVVDVRDIPSGTLVQDPTYPASEKKFFRVP